MKDDFSAVAKGMAKEFIFRSHRYRLETDLDAHGDVKAIRLDSETLPLALRVSLDRECEMMSRGLQLGDTLDGLIETFALKPSDAVYPLVIIDGQKVLSSLANNIWGAAMNLLQREYRPETIMAPPRPKIQKQHKFQVFNGGLA